MPWHLGDGEFVTGDVVIHLDHGVGVLKGLETLVVDGSPDQDAVRLVFAGGTDLIVPVDEMDRVWRYGAGADDVDARPPGQPGLVPASRQDRPRPRHDGRGA